MRKLSWCQVCGRKVLQTKTLKTSDPLKLCYTCYDILKKHLKVEHQVKELHQRLENLIIDFKIATSNLCKELLDLEIELIRRLTKKE